MKYQRILEKIWLSSLESKIYLSLVKNGQLSISELSDISLTHRPAIYSTLPYLMELWLVSEVVKGKRKLYKAESPENLENIFEKTKLDFQEALSELKKEHQHDKKKPILKSVEWENFNKIIFEDVANSLDFWETYMRYSSRDYDNQPAEKYVNYRKIRDEKEIQRLIITSETNAQKKKKSINHELLAIPSSYDLFDDNISKVIYKNKVAIIDYNTQTSFIIEDEKFAQFEAKLFKLLFKYLRKQG